MLRSLEFLLDYERYCNHCKYCVTLGAKIGHCEHSIRLIVCYYPCDTMITEGICNFYEPYANITNKDKYVRDLYIKALTQKFLKKLIKY